MVAAFIAFVFIFCAVFAKWVAPYNPFDAASLELMDSLLPPAWTAQGSAKYLLGTDDQGRDILSALMYGTRISLVVGMASVMLSLLVGVSLGLIAGFRGGWLDAFLMRLCDVMLSFPAGKDSMTSHKRIRKASSQPPRKPAMRPRLTPTSKESMTEAMPTTKEMRVPYIRADKMSRPWSSVPSKYLALPWAVQAGGKSESMSSSDAASKGL